MRGLARPAPPPPPTPRLWHPSRGGRLTYHFVVSVLGGQMQRDLPVQRGGVDGGGSTQKQPHGLQPALPGCVVQRAHACTGERDLGTSWDAAGVGEGTGQSGVTPAAGGGRSKGKGCWFGCVGLKSESHLAPMGGLRAGRQAEPPHLDNGASEPPPAPPEGHEDEKEPGKLCDTY